MQVKQTEEQSEHYSTVLTVSMKYLPKGQSAKEIQVLSNTIFGVWHLVHEVAVSSHHKHTELSHYEQILFPF